MKKCLDLGKKAFPNNSPNPMVGSVIVYKGKIIGEGYHVKYGCNHAEANAINNVQDKSLLDKSTIYINLEPCSHFGKTPPCSDLIIKYNIPKVVIGCVDTCTKVGGKGIEKMRKKGIEVTVGVLEKESRSINKRFFTFNEKKRPYIILKWAQSKDGFIAPHNQTEPFWMTSYDSKKLTHKWRAEEEAILIGRITAEKDNPLLNIREVLGNNPLRVVIDKDLKLSDSLNLFNNNSKTIIFNKHKSLEIGKNIYIKIDFENTIQNILSELYQKKIQSLIIEGGSKTLQSFIDAKIWDEARIFTSEKKLINGVSKPSIKGLRTNSCKIGMEKLETIEPYK
tara:strand:+ start:568 stop:1578 length:1011 start_codon:yes stop_codon:yes gene_type:complete